MNNEPLITAMLASMPPYICKCGREMGVAFGAHPYGCQPGRCARPRYGDDTSRPNAVRVDRICDPVQLGPVHCAAGRALYDCPCGCGLWTSEPAKLCPCCSELKPATHRDGLVNTCGDCAPGQYGE